MRDLTVVDCGLADYRDVLKRQRRLRELRWAGDAPDTVLIVEHPAVVTLEYFRQEAPLREQIGRLAEVLAGRERDPERERTAARQAKTEEVV